MALHPDITAGAAGARCATVGEIDSRALRRWLKKTRAILKRKGKLDRL